MEDWYSTVSAKKGAEEKVVRLLTSTRSVNAPARLDDTVYVTFLIPRYRQDFLSQNNGNRKPKVKRGLGHTDILLQARMFRDQELVFYRAFSPVP
jgi:hypothetical protein